MKVPDGTFFVDCRHYSKDFGARVTVSQDAIRRSLEELVPPIAEQHGAYLIDIGIRGERNSMVIELFLDADSGLTADMCAKISRGLSEVVDEKISFPGAYHLVVSSPGIDRPLRFPRQFTKHIGRRLRVRIKTEKEPMMIEGTLTRCDSETIEIRQKDGSDREVAFQNIEEAVVLPAW